MRGLAIRVDFVQRKLRHDIQPSDDGPWDALYDAQAMGYHDFCAGREDVPVLFQDEPSLVSAWATGQQFASSLAEMAECAGCQDPELPMCPVHR